MLGLSFVNPSLLPFLALGAVPVVIYLFNRRRYRTVRWAAMDFVRRALQKNRRRLRLENLLVLLVRIAAVLFLVTGIARPIGKALGPLETLAAKRRNLAIVIDSSFSMGYRQGVQTSFERAKKLARDLAGALLEGGDRFALFTMAAETRPLYPSPVSIDEIQKARILSEISELEPSFGATDLGKALAALASYLPRFPGGAAAAEGVEKQVFILTDLQKSSIATERGLRGPDARRAAAELEREGAEITIVDCGPEEAANIAILRLEMPDEVAGVDVPVRLLVTVKSFSHEPAPDLSLDLAIDDCPQGSRPLSLEPGEEKEVELYATFREKGPHRVQVSLKTDDLAADNSRYLALDVREAIDVLVIDGEPKSEKWESETDFFVAALAPAEDSRIARENIFRPRVLREPAFSENDLRGAQVVAVANVIALSDEQIERLEGWVRRGGGLLIFLGPQVDRALWNEKVWKEGKGLFPGAIGETVLVPKDERWFALAGTAFDHPVLRPFAAPDARPLLSTGRFWGYVRLAIPAGDPSVSVLARFEARSGEAEARGAGGQGPFGGARSDSIGGSAPPGSAPEATGDAALVEKRFGRGRVLVFASTADDEWNNFFLEYASLILWQRAGGYLADIGSAHRNLAVGEPFEEMIPQSDYVRAVALTTPAGDQIVQTPEKMPDEPEHFRLAHADTARPGFYEVRFGGAEEAPREAGGDARAPRVEYFAVNVDPEESDLQKIDGAELRSLLPELKAKIEPERGIERLIRAPEKAGGKNELWREALYAALALLVVESGLACAFGRRAA
jgi:hypothetical protein